MAARSSPKSPRTLGQLGTPMHLKGHHSERCAHLVLGKQLNAIAMGKGARIMKCCRHQP
jgi:hypothetical protein